jgi:hypothetical protein
MMPAYVETTRRADGCLAFEFLVDPASSCRCVLFECWQDEPSRRAYELMPHHIELVAIGTSRLGIKNLRALRWADISEPHISERGRTETTDPQRPTMDRLVRSYLANKGTPESPSQPAPTGGQ